MIPSLPSVAVSISVALVCVSVPKVVQAELVSEDPVLLAEASYDRVDFEATLRFAEEALTQGGLRRSRLVRLYELIGMSAAVLEQEERARDAFIRMLALNPDAQLDRNLAPRVRGPYLEARGFWAARDDRLSVEAIPSWERGALRVDLGDPLGVARTIFLRAQVDGSEEWVQARVEAESQVVVPIEGTGDADRLAFSLMVLDEHDNELLLMGSDDDPVVIERRERAREEEGRPFVGSAWFWVVTSVAIAAVVGGGVAAGLILAQERQTVGVESGVSIGVR